MTGSDKASASSPTKTRDCGWEPKSRCAGRSKVYPPRPAGPADRDLLYSKGAALGEERIELGYLLQAHTDGDIYVFFRKANVIAAGGVCLGSGWPIIDWETGGWIGGMVRGHRNADRRRRHDATIIVPADGPPLTRQDLVKQRDMYVAIMGRLETMMESGFGADRGCGRQARRRVRSRAGDPSQFLRLAFRSFWGHVRQFDVV